MIESEDVDLQRSQFSRILSQFKYGDQKEKSQALSRLVALDAQQADCSQMFKFALSVPVSGSAKYITNRRFCEILTEKYGPITPAASENVTGTIIRDMHRQINQLQGIAVRHAGKLAEDHTMGKLVPVILEGVSNTDPYVRKAAALAILKIYHKRPSYLLSFNLIPKLLDLMNDSNPNVSANAVSAAMEIIEEHPEFPLMIDLQLVNNLLTVIDQATEWSQAQILSFVASFDPHSESDAEEIINRVLPRLLHRNSGVVLAAVRCCLKMTRYIKDKERIREIISQVIVPLVGLMNGPITIQFVTVKSMLLLIETYPDMISTDVSMFYIKYDDPSYLKLGKLDVILGLTNERNVMKVVNEFYDYALQTDIEFARKSVRAIGKLCVEFEAYSDYCIDKIASLIQTKIQFVVQECVVIMVDIFRKYKGKYEGIITSIYENLTEDLSDNSARAAMIWILGEYSPVIENSFEILESLFIDEFAESTSDIKLAILTAVVKCCFVPDKDAKPMLNRVLRMSIDHGTDPDLRDRAILYTRILQECPELAKQIVSPDTPPILRVERIEFDDELAHQLLHFIGTLAMMYNKLPEHFVPSIRKLAKRLKPRRTSEDVNVTASLPLLLEAENLQVSGMLQRSGMNTLLILRFMNTRDELLDITEVSLRKNIFGLGIPTVKPILALETNQTKTISIPAEFNIEQVRGTPDADVRIKVRTNEPAKYKFKCSATLGFIFVPGKKHAKVSNEKFLELWKRVDDSEEVQTMVNKAKVDTEDVAKHKLHDCNLYMVAKQGSTIYFTGKAINGEYMIVYLGFDNLPGVIVTTRSSNRPLSEFVNELVGDLLK